MRLRTTICIGLVVLVSAAVIATTGLKVKSNQPAKQTEDLQLPIVAKQLPSENGVIPVELKCGTAHLIPPGRLEEFSCILKNNTNKNILATNVAYSVIFESDGKEAADTRFHTIDTFVHPDFYEANKSIQPGGESIIGPPGPSFYADSVIKRIEISVEYVEFEDKTTLGPNEKGAQIIADIREGAAKYRNWLAQKYDENGRSTKAITTLLQQDQPLPNELGFKNSYQEQGARAYRTRLRHIQETLGAAQIERYLSR